MLANTRIPLLASLLCFSFAASAGAQPTARLQDEPSQDIRMEVGQTRLIHMSTKVVRVSVADPEVADVQVVTPEQILITAKSVGYTHLIIWGASEDPLVIAVSATRNLDQLREQFKKLFPKEEIDVSAVGDLLVLSGTVRDLRLPARAAEVAALHADRVANLIKVTGDQQVQLDVRFAEVSRTGLRKSGVNFLWRDTARGNIGGISSSSNTPGSYLRGQNGIPGTGPAPAPPFVPGPDSSDSFNMFFSTGLSDFPFAAILSILSQEGLAKVLAEPTLVALSGQKASFHAGGEIPITIAQQLGQVSVSFKKFGIMLNFVPTVLGEDTMSLNLGVEVSEPDFSSGVTVTGFEIPAFRTRASDTTVRLKDGQSFAIAGLLTDDTRTTVSKVPGLGDLPILGSLFTSRAYQRNESELLMVVTAHLVKPLQPDEVPLMPGEDVYNDPNDFELFLLGHVEPDRIDDYEERKKKEQAELAAAATGKGRAGAAPAAPASPASPGAAPAAPGAPSSPRPPMPAPLPGTAPPASTQPYGSNQRLDGPLGPVGFMR